MAQNKKQHYVPKMVLRNFACDQKKKQINLIHINSKKAIYAASLRDQCQKPYLYGQDGIFEDNLAEMEGVFHKIIDRLVADESISDDFQTRYHIIELLSVQKSRTLQAEEELNRMADQLTKLMMYNRFDRDVLEKVKLTVIDAASQNVVQALLLCPIMYDLKHFLVINRTKTPFIISDNPVSHTNWFCHARLRGRSAGGIARSGLQVFMPVSPHHALLLHDKYVYQTDNHDHVIELQNPQEVDSINEIQWLNAYKNIYFPPGFDEAHIDRCLSWERDKKLPEITRLKATDKPGQYVATDKTIFDGPEEGVTRELIHFGAPESAKDLRIGAVHIRRKPVYFDNESAASPMRDPAWSKIVEEFAVRVENKQLQYNRLWESASSHPLFLSVRSEIRKIERALKIP
jgi:hypothetical protein